MYDCCTLESPTAPNVPSMTYSAGSVLLSSLLFLMAVAGCRETNTSDLKSEPPKVASAASHVPADSTAASSETAAIESRLDKAIDGDDPNVDPHVEQAATLQTTSRWSGPLKKQLKSLASILTESTDDDLATIDVLADSVRVPNFRAGQRREVFRDQLLFVEEIGYAGGNQEQPTRAADVIQSMRKSLFLNSEDAAVKFKLFGIEAEGPYLVTRQRMTAVGSRDGRKLRSHAVWDGVWEIPGPSGQESPRLVALRTPTLVQTEARSPRPAFRDVAPEVLGKNPAWGDQLQWGMNTWARRIDRSLSPDFLGYHGLAIADVNGDALEDIYLCQPGGLPNLLFQQQSDGSYLDVSHAANVDWLDNSTGALFLDLDNDDDVDLVVATRPGLLVMENDGTGRFLQTARLPIDMGYSPSAADFDGDGDLDLLILRYTSTDGKTGDFPTPHPFHDARNGGANVLLENRGNFRFVDVTEARGLNDANYRFSFAGTWEDYDNDGDQDIYVANDFGPNQLFRNDGGTFVEVSRASGTQDWGFGMSAAWADYDRDGSMDLYVSSMFSGAGNQVVGKSDFNPAVDEQMRGKYLKMVRGNTLLRNLGSGQFSDVTHPMEEGFAGWAWGAQFADLNNDGWEDLYVANGYLSQPDKDDL